MCVGDVPPTSHAATRGSHLRRRLPYQQQQQGFVAGPKCTQQHALRRSQAAIGYRSAHRSVPSMQSKVVCLWTLRSSFIISAKAKISRGFTRGGLQPEALADQLLETHALPASKILKSKISQRIHKQKTSGQNG
eukprot:1160251-Pelagomonas_calceolata.AAC.2